MKKSKATVFYSEEGKKKGVILVEFKYIEDEFSICTSFKNKEIIRENCDSLFFHKNKFDLINIEKKDNPDCGYLKYNNWFLTSSSNVFSVDEIKKLCSCPFKFSINQLWRNMLLAENVASKKNLPEFHFWVLCPEQNTYLWNNHNQDIEKEFRNILTPKGNSAFKILDIEKDIVNTLEGEKKSQWANNWLMNFREKYLTNIKNI